MVNKKEEKKSEDVYIISFGVKNNGRYVCKEEENLEEFFESYRTLYKTIFTNHENWFQKLLGLKHKNTKNYNLILDALDLMHSTIRMRANLDKFRTELAKRAKESKSKPVTKKRK